MDQVDQVEPSPGTPEDTSLDSNWSFVRWTSSLQLFVYMKDFTQVSQAHLCSLLTAAVGLVVMAVLVLLFVLIVMVVLVVLLVELF